MAIRINSRGELYDDGLPPGLDPRTMGYGGMPGEGVDPAAAGGPDYSAVRQPEAYGPGPASAGEPAAPSSYNPDPTAVNAMKYQGGFDRFMNSPYMALASAAAHNVGDISAGRAPRESPFSAMYDVRKQNQLLMDRKYEMMQLRQQREEDQLLRNHMIDLQMQKLNAAPDLKVMKMADGNEYYVDPTGATPPRRVDPGMQQKPDKTGSGSGDDGPFQGAGMEAGMYNIVADPAISWDDPNKKAAAAYLSRPKTVMTPEGPQTIPGQDLTMYGYDPTKGAGGSSPDIYGEQTTPLTVDQAQNRGFYATAERAHEELIPLEKKGVAMEPEMLAAYLQGRDSPMLGLAVNSAMTPDQRRYMDLIMDSGMVKLRDDSGAALSKEDIISQLRQIVTTTKDSPDQRRDKFERRVLAIDKFRISGGRWSPQEQEQYNDKRRSWYDPSATAVIPETIAAPGLGGTAPGEEDPLDPATWRTD